MTGNPVGLLVVAAVAFLVLGRLPEVRWFFLGSLALGIFFGVALWLRTR